jgi:hypothetical protein
VVVALATSAMSLRKAQKPKPISPNNASTKPDVASSRDTVRMAHEIVNPIIAETKDLLDAFDRYNERHVAFQQKLLLLDGATLALTFTILTALSTIKGGGFPPLNLQMLLWSWRLLVAAIIFSLVGQVTGLWIMSATERGNKTAVLRMRLNLVKSFMPNLESESISRLTSAGGTDDETDHLNSPPAKRRRFFRAISNLIAVSSTVIAFVLLLLFAQANVRILGGGK